MDAIGYCRVSTEDQAEKGVSLEAQAEKIRLFAALGGLTLVDVYRDDGISGKSMRNRPGLLRALSDVEARKGILVVYSISRLGRNTQEVIQMAERLHQAGAQFASITEKIDTTTAMGRMFFTLSAAFAQLEREITVERTQAALDHKRTQGETVGNTPYGFGPSELRGRRRRREEAPTKLTPDPREWPGLLLILRRMGDPELGYGDLARELNAKDDTGAPKYPTRSGSPWDRGVVRRIVRFHRGAQGALLRAQFGISIGGDVAAPSAQVESAA